MGQPQPDALGGITRSTLAGRIVRILNRGNRHNPDVFLVRSDLARVVVKDFLPRGPLMQALLGPWITSREIRAYLQLEGHAAVPRLLGRIDALALAVEFRPGRRMSRKLAGQVPQAFFAELEDAVAGLHERGVVHLDLRHRGNVLAGDDGRPVLIDFASAVCFRPGSLGARWLLPWLAAVDRRALEKWRVRLQDPSPGVGSASGSDA